jgi:hypothetical protein
MVRSVDLEAAVISPSKVACRSGATGGSFAHSGCSPRLGRESAEVNKSMPHRRGASRTLRDG